MGKLKINIEADKVKEALESSGDFEEAPPGVYVVEVAAVEEKKKDGGEYPYLEVRARPVALGREADPLPARYGNIWDRLSQSPSATWKMIPFCLAMGMKLDAKGALVGELVYDEGKPGTIIGKKALLRVKKDKTQDGDYRAGAGTWMPLEGGAGEDLNDAFDDEEEATNPFDEEEATTTEDTDDDEMYTEESLGALDNSELAAVLPEFDLEANNLKVKNGKKLDVEATRAKMIEAILEAQNGTDDDDEDPF